MGIFSSGNKWKNRAKGEEAMARAWQNYQEDVDFGRNLLSNIRQQRIASSQITAYNYSDDWTSSSVAGAQANINSALAGEMGYSYETSERAQTIRNHLNAAQEYYRKYAKQQRTRGIAYAVAGLAAGALTGGALAGLGLASASIGSAALTGAGFGQGVGQVAAGNWQQGIQNIGRGLLTVGVGSMANLAGNAAAGAQASGGTLIGSVGGQRLYDLTGTAMGGGNVNFVSGSYLP